MKPIKPTKYDGPGSNGGTLDLFFWRKGKNGMQDMIRLGRKDAQRVRADLDLWLGSKDLKEYSDRLLKKANLEGDRTRGVHFKVSKNKKDFAIYIDPRAVKNLKELLRIEGPITADGPMSFIRFGRGVAIRVERR